MTPLRRDMLLLFITALAVRALAMLPATHPGYLDAAYYYDVALNLARGHGLNEPFLWNYLDNPAGLPHPSHLYWMPLATLLAWLGIQLFGQSYRAAQIPFIVLSALLPLISYYVALQVTRRRFYGWIAGLLTVFSGFYVVFWGHTDNFTPFALAGSLCLIAGWKAVTCQLAGRVSIPAALENPTQAAVHSRPASGASGFTWLLAAGALAGLAHLSRADGVLLLIALIVFVALRLRLAGGRMLSGLACLAVGYLLVMLPWFARNWMVVGTPLPTVGVQTLWLTTYDDLYAYGQVASLPAYLGWGWGNILRSKLEATWLDAQTVVAVLGMVFLAPLAVIGAWRLRGHDLMRLAGGYGLALFLAMSLAFTFPGPRGGLFHSGAALLPFVYAAALVGLDGAVEWVAARRRTWNVPAARQVFGAGFVALAMLVSAFVYDRGVVTSMRWRMPDGTYTQLAAWLAAQGEPGALVMLGDPTGYWYVSGGPSIAVPNEPPETALAAANRYGARYLVLDAGRPAPLAGLYAGESVYPRLQPVHTFTDSSGQPVVVFRIEP